MRFRTPYKHILFYDELGNFPIKTTLPARPNTTFVISLLRAVIANDNSITFYLVFLIKCITCDFVMTQTCMRRMANAKFKPSLKHGYL